MSEFVVALAIMIGRGVILLGLAFLAHAFLRRRSAATQNHFWRRVVVVMLALPLLAFVPPLWQFDMTPSSPKPLLEDVIHSGVIGQTTSSVIVTELEALDVVEEPELGFPLHVSVVLVLWLLGALWLIVRYGWGYLKLVHLKQRSIPLEADSPWMTRDCPRVFVSHEVPVPLVFGLRRPCLLLPTDVLHASAKDRQMILRHEIAHIRRRDGLFQLLHCLASALHWPNPLIWAAANRLRLSEERAVDDEVLTHGHPPIDYAELLAQFAAQTFMNHSKPLHAMAQASTVRARVHFVLNANQARQAPSGWLKLMLNVSLVLSVVLLGGAQAQNARTSASEDPAVAAEADGFKTDVYAVDRERWQAALKTNGVTTTVSLLAKAGITLPAGSGAVYDRELSRVSVCVPEGLQTRLQEYFAETFDAYPRSSWAVKLTCHVVELNDKAQGQPWIDASALDVRVPTLAGVFTSAQRETILRAWKKTPSVAILASPDVLTLSGHPASIQFGHGKDSISLFLHPTVLQDEESIELAVNFDPPEAKGRVTTTATFLNESAVAFASKANKKNRITLIAAEIVRLKDTLVQPAKGRKRPEKSTIETVVLDPGHGGQDAGSREGDLKESALTLDLAKQVRRELEDRGYQVMLTRQNDRYVPLNDRPAMANGEKDAVFVSLHFNAASNTALRGIETFYPKPTDDGPRREPSALLAKAMQASMAEAFGAKTRNRGIRAANWKVLTESQVPAVLIEGAFLTNPDDLALVKQPDYFKQLATSIANGVIAFDDQRTKEESN